MLPLSLWEAGWSRRLTHWKFWIPSRWIEGCHILLELFLDSMGHLDLQNWPFPTYPDDETGSRSWNQCSVLQSLSPMSFAPLQSELPSSLATPELREDLERYNKNKNRVLQYLTECLLCWQQPSWVTSDGVSWQTLGGHGGKWLLVSAAEPLNCCLKGAGDGPLNCQVCYHTPKEVTLLNLFGWGQLSELLSVPGRYHNILSAQELSGTESLSLGPTFTVQRELISLGFQFIAKSPEDSWNIVDAH